MRTNKIKELVEISREDYQEYVDRCIEDGSEPMDIFTFVVTEEATAQEYYNDYLRDEGISDESSNDT